MPHSMHAERPARVALAALSRQSGPPKVLLARTRTGFEVPHSNVDAGLAPEQAALELARQVGLQVNAALLVKDMPLAGVLTRVFVMEGIAPSDAQPGRGPVYWWRKAGMDEAFHVLSPEFEPLVALLEKVSRRAA
jgi:hypothetical protein